MRGEACLSIEGWVQVAEAAEIQQCLDYRLVKGFLSLLDCVEVPIDVSSITSLLE